MRSVRYIAPVLTPPLVAVLLLGSSCSHQETEPPPRIPPPSAPVASPAGPDLILEPGARQTIHASSQGAEGFDWRLEGDGTLSSQEGDTVLFTAPSMNGATSLVKVTAHNAGGVSPSTSLSIRTVAAPAVRIDGLGIPAGWMTDSGGDPTPYIELKSEPGACRDGGTCLKVAYRPGGIWGGIWWWPQGCGRSGTRDAWQRFTSGACAIKAQEAGPLTSISKLTLWAKGIKGGEVVEFKVGASDVLPKPGRSTGKVTLSGEWQKFEIDLEGLDTTRIAGLFAWIAADLDNPEGAVFYLDDVQFEGAR